MLQRLPITFGKVKASNTEDIPKKVRQMLILCIEQRKSQKIMNY